MNYYDDDISGIVSFDEEKCSAGSKSQKCTTKSGINDSLTSSRSIPPIIFAEPQCALVDATPVSQTNYFDPFVRFSSSVHSQSSVSNQTSGVCKQADNLMKVKSKSDATKFDYFDPFSKIRPPAVISNAITNDDVEIVAAPTLKKKKIADPREESMTLVDKKMVAAPTLKDKIVDASEESTTLVNKVILSLRS